MATTWLSVLLDGSGFFVETKDVVFLAIAGYAALVSTVTLIRALVRDRRRVRVSHNFPLFVSQGLSIQYISIEVVNTGHRSVTITNLVWNVPGGKSLNPFPPIDLVQEQLNTKLPVELSDGESAKMVLELDKVRSTLRENGFSGEVPLIPQATDSLGKVHLGKGVRIEI